MLLEKGTEKNEMDGMEARTECEEEEDETCTKEEYWSV